MESRIVVVTGGSMGIGYSTAKKFLEHGDKVAILSIDDNIAGKKVEEQLSEYGEVMWIKADVSNRDDCKNAVEAVFDRYGRIDVLVNNAGVVGKRTSFLSVDLDDTLRTLQINVMGTIQMTSYASQYMKEQGKGVVVNIGSLCGISANAESVGYHASKGAVRMVTQSLARELSPYGIRVVSAAPGWVKTNLVTPEMEDIGNKLHMTGKILSPEQIAGTVYILTLDEASGINGTTVMVDDGYTSFKGVDGISYL